MSEHVAGRELDALVAEKVMGLVWDNARCRVCGWRLGTTIVDGCTLESCSQRPTPRPRADAPAPYSTDIAAAWQVVDTMRARGWYSSHTDLTLSTGHAWWSFHFTDSTPPGNRSVSQQAETLPMAICLAALAALAAVEEGNHAD